MIVRTVAHTGVTVSSLAASLRLFTGPLGFALEREFTLDGEFAENVVGVPDAEISAAVVSLGSTRVELLQYLAPPASTYRPRPCDVGSWHLALDVDDLDAVALAIADHGFALAGLPQTMSTGPREGTRFAYAHDNDGLTLELIQAA